jgi:putative oxidoreductase
MDVLAPLGRLLFSALFITSGLKHFIQVESMTAFAQSAGLPAPRLAILGTGAMLLVGGVCVLLGSFARLGAALIALFLVAAAFLMHRFWGLADPQQAMQQQGHFLTNVAMAGAALLIVYFGPGPFSLRRTITVERERRRSPYVYPLRHRRPA